MRLTPLFLVSVLFSPILGDEKKPDEGPAKPAEFKVLGRLTGRWKDEVTYKVSEWTKKEKHETASYQNDWTLGGWFIRYQGRSGDGKTEELQLMTFDVEKKVFRKWYYDSEGFASESSGKWDAKSATLTWTSDLGDGITAVSVWRFADDNNVIWTRVARDRQGKTYLNIEGKSVRQK